MPVRQRLALGLVLIVLATPARSGENEPPPGFVALFNGRDLSGWHVPEGDNGHWKVMDGVIDYDAASEAKGDKSLWTERTFGDFVLRLDWRLKEAPYLNRYVPYILPDGSHARDFQGKEMHLAIPDADSGILLRGSGEHQVNIWCWPIGSGELMYGLRSDPRTPADLRTLLTPRTQADHPVGEWNRFEITVKGDSVRVVLNERVVIPGARLPGLADRGRIGLQHHGQKRDGQWVGPPSLIQFRNVFIKSIGN
jgi:Domain of Unknown Function (DUF1080)